MLHRVALALQSDWCCAALLTQTISLAMVSGVQTQKRKRNVSVGQQGQPTKKKKKNGTQQAAEGGVEDEDDLLQRDPLRGKVREPLPDEYLQRVMRWYVRSVLEPPTLSMHMLPRHTCYRMLPMLPMLPHA